MSILFKALNKAAQDYRSHKAPIVIPLVKMPSTFEAKRRFKKALIIIGCAIAVVAASFYYLYRDVDSSIIVAQKPADLISVPVMPDRLLDGIPLEAEVEDILSAALVEKEVVPKSKTSMVVTRRHHSLKRMMQKADYAIELGAYDKALDLYKKILWRKPDHKGARLGQVYALGQRGRKEDLLFLDEYISNNPYSGEAYAAKARIYAKQNDLRGALLAWERAHKTEPRNKTYGLGLAVTYDKLGQGKKALEVYRSIPKPLTMAAQRRMDYLNAQEMARDIMRQE